MNARIDDVARRAGVSVATVSRALRGLSNVAPPTRERVLQAAADLRYTVNPNASRLAAGRSMTVAVVVGSPAGWFTGHVVAAVERTLGAHGYDILLRGAGDVDGIEVDALRSRVDGLILVDIRTGGQPVDGPVLSVGLDLADIPSVTTDPVAAAFAGARHLRRLGHRRIDLIGHADTTASTIAMKHLETGRSQALREIGVDPRGASVVREDVGFGGGIEAMATLLRGPRPPTAVLAGSDEMAAGARWAAVEAGLAVPRDLSIVGFGGRDVAVHADLTTVTQPVTEMGEITATLLLARMGGAEVTDVVLPSGLEVRGSTGRDRPSRNGGRRERTGQGAVSRPASSAVDGAP